MKKNRFLISVVVAVVIMSGALLVFNGCEKEEEIPWYEDYENWEVVIEDERSVEKSYTKGWSHEGHHIVFNYPFDVTDKKECIPRVRVYYKGVEQSIFTYVQQREGFYRYADGVDYDKPILVNAVKEIGNFRVTIEIYLSKEEFDKPINHEIHVEYIYINIIKGE